jgi:addiction module RelB/DinJ family antitoxin
MNSTIQAEISPEVKQEAEAIFAAMGMTTAEAIRLFLYQTVNSRALPFQPTTYPLPPSNSTGNPFLRSIVGIAPTAQTDLAAQAEEILAAEIDPVRGWGLAQDSPT